MLFHPFKMVVLLDGLDCIYNPAIPVLQWVMVIFNAILDLLRRHLQFFS